MASQKNEVNQFVIKLDEEDVPKMIDAMLSYGGSLVDDIRTLLDDVEDGITEMYEMPDSQEILMIEKTIADLKMARELSRALVLWMNGQKPQESKKEKGDVGIHFNPIP